MEINLLIKPKNQANLRNWLSENHQSEKEVWVLVNRGKNTLTSDLSYLDVVEEACVLVGLIAQ